MKKNHIFLILVGAAILLISVGVASLFMGIPGAEFGFSREIPESEQQLRLTLVKTAESWLGAQEEDGSHQPIIDLYNSHEPLAEGYTVTYEDSWCAVFVSAAATQTELTDIIPTECSCQRQIALFQKLQRWEEADDYLPLPGDIIYYAWDDSPIGDCTGWADHVGIVVGTWGPFIKVVEGNMDDQVGYHYILRNDPTIRGYGLPDYSIYSP